MFDQLSGTRDSLKKTIKTIVSVSMPLLLVGTAATLVSIEGPAAKRESDPIEFRVKRITMRHHGPRQLYRTLNATQSESPIWAGYGVLGPQGSVTDVKSSWVVPYLTCPGPGGSDTYAAFWTGIDGWTSKTVEQTGTESDCAGGTASNYAWYEIYPEGLSYTIGSYNKKTGNCESYCVHPLDIISAEVSAGPGGNGPKVHGSAQGGGSKFTLTITDWGASVRETPEWTFTTSHSVGDAQQSSAEWIVETLSPCNTTNGYCYLSNFGMANFGQDFTKVLNTESATVGGLAGPLGSFGDVQESISVDPSDPSSDNTMAEPTSLDSTGSFEIDFTNAGP